MALYVNPDKCPQDHKCPLIPECPMGAISQEGIGLPKIDTAECIVCRKCMRTCPKQAIYEVKDI